MGSADCPRRLIVNADDFGRSHSINQAVVRAHHEGILTAASLMVNGAGFAEAVELARACPRLGVGLHLTLVCGQSTLPAKEIPDLVSAGGCFRDDPVNAGFRYFFQRSIRLQLEREIAAQFRLFQETGLPVDHVNGHLNMHLHPAVFGSLMEHATELGIRCVRLTRDPLRINLRLASGRWPYRLSHALIFGLLSRWVRPQLERRQIRHTRNVFGLLQTGCVDETFVLRLLQRLPPGDSELYSHPCLHNFTHEFEALISRKVQRLVQENRIELIRYQDL